MRLKIKNKILLVLLTILVSFISLEDLQVVNADSKQYNIAGIVVDKDIAKDDKAIKALLDRQGRGKELDEFKKNYGTILKNISEDKYKGKDKKGKDKYNNFTKDMKGANKSYKPDWSKGMYETKWITSDGFLTGGKSTKYPTCYKQMADVAALRDFQIEKLKKNNEIKTEKEFADSELQKKKGSKMIVDTTTGAMESIIDSSDATDKNAQKNESGLLGARCGAFSVMNWFQSIYHPVNITSNSVIMDLTFGFQIVALGLSVLLISIYAIYYALGQSKDDPIRFVLRTFITLLLVFYLPYVAQDILNINNMLVFFLAGDGVSLSGGISELASVGLLASLSSLLSVIASVTIFASIPGVALFIGIFLLIVIVMILKAIFTIVFWWYARFLMIMFLVILGPLFMVMMLLPQTASYSKKWFSYFIGEVATQFTLALGVYFASKVISNIDKLADINDFSVVGQMFLVYATFILLTRMPQISKSLIGSEMSGAVGWNDAKDMAKKVGNAVQNAGMAFGGALGNKINKDQHSKWAENIQDLEDNRKEMSDNDPKAKDLDGKIQNMRDGLSLRDAITNKTRDYAGVLKSGDMSKVLNQASYTKAFNAAHNEALRDNKIERAKEDYAVEKEKADLLGEQHGNKLKDTKNERDKSIADAKDGSKKLSQEERQNLIDKANEKYDRAKTEYDRNMGDLDKDKYRIMNKAEEQLKGQISKSVGDGFNSPIKKAMEIDKIASEIMNDVNQTDFANRFGNGNKQQGLDTENAEGQLKNAFADFNNSNVKSKRAIAKQLQNFDKSLTDEDALEQAGDIMDAYRTKQSLSQMQQKGNVLSGEQSQSLAEAKETLGKAFEGKNGQGLESLVKRHASEVSGNEASVMSAMDNLERVSGLSGENLAAKVSEIQSGSIALGAMKLDGVQQQLATDIKGLASGANISLDNLKSTVSTQMLNAGYTQSDVDNNIGQVVGSIQTITGSMATNMASGSSVQLEANMAGDLQKLGFDSKQASSMAKDMVVEAKATNFEGATRFAEMYNANLSEGQTKIQVPDYGSFIKGDDMSPIDMSSYGGVSGVSVMPDKAISGIVENVSQTIANTGDLTSSPNFKSLQLNNKEAASQLQATYGRDASNLYDTYSNAARESIKVDKFTEIANHIKENPDKLGLKADYSGKDVSAVYGSRQEVVEVVTNYLTGQKDSNNKPIYNETSAQSIAKSFASEQVLNGKLNLEVEIPDSVKNLAMSVEATTTESGGNKESINKLFGKSVNDRMDKIIKQTKQGPKDTNQQ